MAKYVNLEKYGYPQEHRMIIARFKNQEELDTFAVKHGFQVGQLTNLTDEVMLLDGVVLRTRKTPRKLRVTTHWQKYWQGMPHFHNESTEAYAVIKFYFPGDYTTDQLSDIFNQSLTDKTTSIWVPKKVAVGTEGNLRVIGGSSETRFPVYIVSKGRHDCCLTSQYMTACNVKHYVVVEQHQLQDYQQTVGQSPYVTLLTIPQRFFDEYETHCDYENNEGETRKTGPGAARNFAWWHSMQNGFEAHHVLDDNMRGFHMLSDNMKIKVRTGAIIRLMEDHFMACENAVLGGPCYSMFAPKTDDRGAFITNTRIYSWILIKNHIWDEGIQWRARYNEDSILSIDVMKKGYSTIQYYVFLQNKIATQSLPGGNTEEFYAKEGTVRKSEMLAQIHPDCSKVVWRFSRVHHYVDYSIFSGNELRFNPDLLPNGTDTNDGGMYVVKIKPDEVNNNDNKDYLEKHYTKDDAVYMFNGEHFVNGFDLEKDFIEKGY